MTNETAWTVVCYLHLFFNYVKVMMNSIKLGTVCDNNTNTVKIFMC
jgi:hypothetical protein